MLISEELIRDAIKQENIIGKGGNGVVYRIPNTELVIKKLNVSISKSGIKDLNDKRKYLRFRDEIKIVQQQQDSVSGILPIKQCSILSDNPSKDDLIYYIMPFAESIEKVRFKSIGSILKCFISLYKTLEYLHKNMIGHRDIKPSNIYRYNNEYCFSDFGLVSFPGKSRNTFDEKKVGAWSTIAPEMERNPMNADPLKADIYSMAKTLWIILTGKIESFEGQYNHKESMLSINDKIGKYEDSEYFHFGIINDVLTRSTSNNPDSRPQISEIITLLNYLVEGNSERICEFEWGYLLDDLIGQRPTEIRWTNFESIVSVLERISQTHSLNHVFLPSGGGLDLKGVKGYKNKYIELDLGYKRIVNPKAMYLRTYESADFNHFYLETNPIHIINDNGLCVSDDRYDDLYLKVSEDKYIESWNANYPKYMDIDTSGLDEVVVSHKGSYAFFPKMSYYNIELDRSRFKICGIAYYFDPYSSLHEKIGSANKFAEFIEEVMEIKTSGKVKHETIIKHAESCESRLNLDHYKDLRQSFDDYIANLSIAECAPQRDEYSDLMSVFKYSISFQIGIELYYLSIDLKLQKEKTSFSFDEMFSSKDNENEMAKKYECNSYEFAKQFIENILSMIRIETYAEVGITKVIPILDKKRLRKAEYTQFSRNDFLLSFQNGDDIMGGYVVLDHEFNIQIIDRESYDAHVNNYSLELDDIRHHSNIFGKRSDSRAIEYIDSKYKQYLYKIYKYLQTSDYVISDDDEDEYEELELLNKIERQNSQYT